MSAPRRWLEDPDADEALRDVLRTTPRARPLDAMTRRRLRVRVARASAVPAVAAGWLFVKSAAAALGLVLGTGALAVATGVLEWSPRPVPPSTVTAPHGTSRAAAAPVPAPPRLAAAEPVPEVAPPKSSPALSLPVAPPLGSSAGTLSVEAALLEQARRQVRTAPATALSVAAEHAQRFPHGQLMSERTLIQLEALHRLHRDAEARSLARGLLGGPGSGLYAERVHRLLGENLEP